MAATAEYMYTLNSEKIDVNKCAILVKLADKYSNLFGLIKDPPTSWKKEEIIGYVIWSYKCVNAMKGFNLKLDAKLDQLFEDLFKYFEIDTSNLETALNDYYAFIG